MKRILASALSAALLLTMLAGCGGNNNSSNNGSSNTGTSSASNTDSGDKVVKIGVFEPQSGDNGAGGKQEILGMQYAHSLTPTVEIGGETYTVELVYADNQSANDKAPSAAQTLVSARLLGGAGLLWLRCVHRRFRHLWGRGCARHRRDLHQPPDHHWQRPLLPHLLHRSLPGHSPG